MVVPVIQEQVKNKELLIEVDSIVTDNKDLANVSLSSNDSLSKSRRKWRLIRIINKLNPALAERKYKFPTLKFFFALFLIILTSLIIYWSFAPRSAASPRPDCPSSIPLKSITSQPVSPSPALQESYIFISNTRKPPASSTPPTYETAPFKPVQTSRVKVSKDPEFETLDQFPWFSSDIEESADFVPILDEEEYPGFKDFSLSDYPDPGFMSNFPASFNDLSDTFALRSNDNSDLVLASVDKFIKFFKSMINF